MVVHVAGFSGQHVDSVQFPLISFLLELLLNQDDQSANLYVQCLFHCAVSVQAEPWDNLLSWRWCFLCPSKKKKKDILANANNVAEQAAAVKALKAGDKAAASIMAV